MVVSPAWRDMGDEPHAAAVPGAVERLSAAMTAVRERQTGRVFLWAPVALAGGVALYFGIGNEPPASGFAAVALIACLCFWLAGRLRRPAVCLLCAVALTGFCLGKLRTYWTQAPVFAASSSGPVMVHGWVERIIATTRNRPHIVLDVEKIDGLKPQSAPGRIEMRLFSTEADLLPGDFVKIDARLFSPPWPVSPGSYDHARSLWLQGIGATGRGKLVRPDAAADSTAHRRFSWRRPVDRIRRAINERVERALPDRTAGFAIALMTGDRSLISNRQRDDLAVAGLAHVLAISGLHMSLVAGGVFWLVRALLALCPGLVLNYPVKKWSAAAGFVAAAGYLLISGAGIATQRAFIMLVIMLLAVMVSRPAISLRNLAVAALIVIVLTPEAVVSASFHMSFLAVMGLIAAYEGVRDFRARSFAGYRTRTGLHPALRWAGYGIAGLAFTTIVAGVFSGLPAAYHFNRIAPYSLLANLLALPVVSLVVMPSAVAGVLLMPLGLEAAPLWLTSAGLDYVLGVAHYVRELDGADYTIAKPAFWPVLIGVGGAIWLCLMNGMIRTAGLAVMAIALIFSGARPEPSVLVEASAGNVAIRNGDARLALAHPRRGRFSAERWLRDDGDTASLAEAAARPGWTCAQTICEATLAGRKVLYLSEDAGIPADCGTAHLVVARVPLRGKCDGAAIRIDRFDVWRSGSHVIFVAADGAWTISTARQMRGNRPWVKDPVARRDVLMPPTATSRNASDPDLTQDRHETGNDAESAGPAAQ